VAGFALQAECARMAGRFLVAGRTSCRGAVELLGGMALSALECGMRAVEYEESIMVKVVHPVDPIVAGGTGRTKLGDMRLHKSGVMLGVAIGTGGLVVMRHV